MPFSSLFKNFFGRSEPSQVLKPIPLDPQKADQLEDIFLSGNTTAISFFVWCRNFTSSQSTLAEENCVLPEQNIVHLKRHAAYFNRLGVPYMLAVDLNVLSEKQRENIGQIAAALSIGILDVSKLATYKSYEDSCDSYRNVAKQINAEYFDKTKLMILDLAGKRSFKDILVIDFDVVLNSDSLKIMREDLIAFDYSQRQARPSTAFNTENSMIFVRKNRPKLNKNGEEKDLIEDLLNRIKYKLENNQKSFGEMSSRWKEHCFVFSLTCHDVLLEMHNIEYTRPFVATHESENEIAALVNGLTVSGNYLIHGEQFSDNLKTWAILPFHSIDLTYVPMEQALRLALGEVSEPLATARLS